MVTIHRLLLNPPILNSSSFWASSREQLEQLFASAWTGGVTTRTATIAGFPEDTASVHKHAIIERNSSINSYGYSPIQLAQYLEWIKEMLSKSPSANTKPFIISLAPASPQELSEMLNLIQDLRTELNDINSTYSRIGIELNTSCPNISGHPPPAYSPESLKPLLQVFQERYAQDPTLTIGLKLAPYVHAGQFKDIIDLLASISTGEVGYVRQNCVSFLSCTNTLGSSIVFEEQTVSKDSSGSVYAVPTVTGGLAGEPLHALALGNVYTFKKLLSGHSDPSLQGIAVIGIGGVSTKEAVSRMRHVGASAVECATALGIHGVGIFEELNEGL